MAVVSCAIFVLLSPSAAPRCYAGVATTGNVEPGNPAAWTTSTIPIVGNSADGTLTVNGGSDIVSATAYLGYNNGVTGVASVDGAGSTWASNSTLYLGFYSSSGTLNITNGGVVNTRDAQIGVGSNSTGKVTVDGAGSMWTCSQSIIVGSQGSGTLNITNGGMVSSQGGFTSAQPGSISEMTVAGAGSTWMCDGYLWAYWGPATLAISNGGQVSVTNLVTTNSSTEITIHVTNNDMLQVGTAGSHDLTNNGTIRLAASDLSPGTYTPISVTGNWAGSGSYEAFGGVWNNTAHTFTVATGQATTSGVQTTIDLSSQQRIEVGSNLVASFQPTAGSTLMDFTAMTTSGVELTALEALIGPDEIVQGSWDFSLTGLPSGDDALLNFALTGNPGPDDLTVWHNDGSGWTQYAATDLRCTDGWANFTVDDFSSYAITSVPEPTTTLAISSFTSLGGGEFELKLKGENSTAYEFFSSPTLAFPGTQVTGLTEGVPAVGTITDGFTELTTDGSGNGTVRMSPGGSVNFVRARRAVGP